jgi:uroporphyrinogen decarboxylase
MMLSHRERILRAIEGKEVDRVPLFFRADAAVNGRIRRHYGLKTDDEIPHFFGTDAVHVPLARNPKYASVPDSDGYSYDVFGNKLQTSGHGAATTSAVVQPVLPEGSTLDDVLALRLPADFLDVDASRKAVLRARESGLAVYGGAWATLFTAARAMMGEEHFLLSTIADPELVAAVIERLLEFYLSINEQFFAACSEHVDVFYFGSDFGTQASMFISPAMFAQYFKPAFTRLIAQAHQHKLKVMYHTCGAVGDLIPHLIECGVEVLDPVQVSATGMQPQALAGRFKGQIAFHGGISTQTTLPFGTPEAVRDETLSTIRLLGPRKLIVAPDQEIIGDVPVENIAAMFEAAKSCRL